MKDDTISRAVAIDALDALCDRECEYSKKQRNVMCGACHLGTAFDVIEQLPSAQQWIPCSERLPYAEYGESDTVLTTCGYRDVEDTSVRWIRLLYFNGGNWCYPTGETYEAKVYAWCPLPEPYKEEQP